MERRNVTFNRRIHIRPIPAEGKGTRTPARGGKATLQSKWRQKNSAAADTPIDSVVNEPVYGATIFGLAGLATRANGKRWADVEEDASTASRVAMPTERRHSEPPAADSSDSAVAHSSGKTAKFVIGMHRSVADNRRHRTAVEGESDCQQLESRGPRSGLRATARTAKPATSDIFFYQEASSPRASSAAGGALIGVQSEWTGRDIGARRRWRRTVHRQFADCQSRRCYLGAQGVYSS